MKFDTTLRPQDKRTIAIVIYIGIVVLFGWYLIRPAAMKIGELDDRIRAAEAAKQEYKMKSLQLASAEVLYNKAVTDINDSTVKFYDVMDNSKIEKMGTSYILGFGLTPVDFMVDIRDGSYVNEAPYIYSNLKVNTVKKTTDDAEDSTTSKSTAKKVDLKDPAYLASLDVKSLQAYYSQAIADAKTTEAAEVQCANITIVVQGTQEKCQQLIDDITKKPSIRVAGFFWTDAKEIWVEDEKGNKTLMNPDYKELRVSLHFYMAEKPDFNK